MSVGDKFQDNQRNGYYNLWVIFAIKGNRVYCALHGNDMVGWSERSMAIANFTKSTISEWEKM